MAINVTQEIQAKLTDMFSAVFGSDDATARNASMSPRSTSIRRQGRLAAASSSSERL